MTDLVAPPPGVGLFICDLPTYYAAGDQDVIIVVRDTSLGDEACEHDRAVAAFLGGLDDHPMVKSMDSSETDPRTGQELRTLVYLRDGVPPSQSRGEELVAPLETLVGRRQRALTRLMLL